MGPGGDSDLLLHNGSAAAARFCWPGHDAIIQIAIAGQSHSPDIEQTLSHLARTVSSHIPVRQSLFDDFQGASIVLFIEPVNQSTDPFDGNQRIRIPNVRINYYRQPTGEILGVLGGRRSKL